jgi:preprotein translocase subunit SecE
VVSKTIDGGSNPSARAKINVMLKYFSESFEELKSNVTWPTWEETQRYTIIVALFSVLFALATWAVDTVFSKSIITIFSLLKGN